MFLQMYTYDQNYSVGNGSYGAENRRMNQSGDFSNQPVQSDKLMVLYNEIVAANGHVPVEEVIRRILLDPEIDLFSIPDIVNAPQGSISHLIYQIIGGNGLILEAVWSDMRVAPRLFAAVRIHADRSSGPRDGLMSRCIVEWIEKLLPLQQSIPASSTIQSSLHSPLELFLPECTFLLSVPPEENDAASVRGVHLAQQLITTLCDAEQFPSVNRFFLLRQTFRQLHSYCLSEGSDPQLASLRRGVHLRPSFSADLYNLFYSCIVQCPSMQSFRELFSVWLTFVRPWRYSPSMGRISPNLFSSSPSTSRYCRGKRTTLEDYSPFFPFVQAHEKFYSVLFGKILKKLRELQITADTVKVVRTAIECSFKPGIRDALEYLGVDAEPAVGALLDTMVAMTRRASTPEAMDEEDYSAFSPYSNSLTQLKNELKQIIQDARNLFNYDPPVVQEEPSSSPRRRLPPDSYLDQTTGLRMLLPSGRIQVASGERSFDFSPSCAQTRGSLVERVLSSPSLGSSLLLPPLLPPSFPLCSPPLLSIHPPLPICPQTRG
ncbi:hypothetical protein PMAYCL1PPCAC_23313 [Pristionchus mayeri]|uniref:Uncharacterized protein n=1 Tax=Pristionchus mayeri TaxID=1317129 RepID=A0AAN5CY75_9BILA|nr:hypothetical protein PMAYCL1PPCAC_23313 [Pristionchus mayeri]